MDAVNDAPAPRRDSHRLAPFPPLMAARRAGQSGSGAAIGSTLDEVTLAALNTALAEATTANLLMDAITSSGRYRIVERFERRDRYHADDGTARRMALYIDVETTGLDTTRDSIIQ
ncbi:MAG TPA: hypothetical protein VGU02_16245, partial [Gaiellaceae bacterium]|nr:hypothetical protein [Gaiellaceae bacterium]